MLNRCFQKEWKYSGRCFGTLDRSVHLKKLKMCCSRSSSLFTHQIVHSYPCSVSQPSDTKHKLRKTDLSSIPWWIGLGLEFRGRNFSKDRALVSFKSVCDRATGAQFRHSKKQRLASSAHQLHSCYVHTWQIFWEIPKAPHEILVCVTFIALSVAFNMRKHEGTQQGIDY